MYGKIYESLFTGSMVGSGSNVFAVWSYVIANTKPDSMVELNPVLLSAALGEDAKHVEEAIKFLCSPDAKSRSKIEEGRRLIPQGEYQFFVPNYARYRNIRNDEERRAYNREKKREQRQRDKHKSNKVSLTEARSNSDVKMSAQAEAVSISKKQKADKKSKPACRELVLAFAKELGLPETDGHYYWDKWQAGGYVNAGKPIRDWQALIRSHKSAGYCPSQKKGFQASSFQKLKDVNQQRREDEYDQWIREKNAKNQ